MSIDYDAAIIGAGCAGIFAAYELCKSAPMMRIILIEQGNKIYNRKCPIIEKKRTTCASCTSCNIMKGFGGTGAFSDGKFNFTTQFGGWLNEYITDANVMELIEYVDSINVSFGATEDTFSTYSPEAKQLEKKALGYDLHLLHAKVKHLGTDRNFEVIAKLYEHLKSTLTLRCNTKVTSIDINDDGSFSLHLPKGEKISCANLIAAPGRAGAEWFSSQCKRLDMPLINNQVDIGVRVELPAKVFDHITDIVYECKLIFRTKQYNDLVRTFCMNPNGHVVTENTDGIITVNGHSYSNKDYQSSNTNFALLVSNKFTDPFNEPYQYGKSIASLSNMLGGGILVQRFGDLIRGVRSNEHRIAQSFTRPTLRATPGDLSLVLTKRNLDNIIEMIYTLDKLAPGTANYDTLLYGVEVKFYSSRLELSSELETKYENFYAIGDGAGITRGLAQSGASGILAARAILKKYT